MGAHRTGDSDEILRYGLREYKLEGRAQAFSIPNLGTLPCVSAG
jgi:hypothetical protein